VIYAGAARRLVLALKHGDRLDIVPALAGWMADAARMMPLKNTIVIPVPLYWQRLLKRRFNQAALLADHVAGELHLDTCPDLLTRTRATQMHEGMTRVQRQKNQAGAFAVTARHLDLIQGKPVLLVDDVMTSGATLAACTEACLSAGAKDVNILVLARVARDT